MQNDNGVDNNTEQMDLKCYYRAAKKKKIPAYVQMNKTKIQKCIYFL